MPRSLPISYSPVTKDAAQILGARIKAARIGRRWTLDGLAERVGVTRQTMAKVEKGDLNVRLGVAFEAAVLVGVPLFEANDRLRSLELSSAQDRLALLPRAARRRRTVDNAF